MAQRIATLVVHLPTYWHYNGLKVCCAAIWLNDMHNITVKRISITVQTSSVSGIILMNVSGIAVQLNTTCFLTDAKTIGIVIYKATSFGLYSSNVSNCSYGLVLHNTTTTDINKVNAMYNEFDNTTTVYNGGLGMYLSTMNDTYITSIHVSHNGADGMLFLSINNTRITNATISHSKMNGMNLLYIINTYITNMAIENSIQFGMALQFMNNTHITNTSVTRNHLYGIFLEKMENTHITKTTATHNALHLLENDMGQIVIYSSTATLINDTSFTDIHSPSMFSTTDPKSLPTVILLSHSTLHVSGCNFTRNSISAVRAHSSNVTVSGTVTFSNNTAFAGPAFVLSGGSVLTSTKNSHIYFLNNHATNFGGVFYFTDNNVYYDSFSLKKSTCFLRPDNRLTLAWKKFTFVNNSAGKGGDILYGGEILFGMEKLTHQNC